MSTNFYWKPKLPQLVTGERVPVDWLSPAIHIGKRFSRGTGKLPSFVWAHPPHIVVAICKARRDDVLIEDTTGASYTGASFLELQDGCVHDLSLVGKWFS